MTRIHVFCEGQTEETFVKEVLGPYFQNLEIWVNPIILRTGPQGKGGVTSYGKVKWQIEKKCKEDPNSWVTTLIDYYALPTDFPSKDGTGFDKPQAAKLALEEDIGQPNFLANFLIHEFEGLLFSDTEKFSLWFDDHGVTTELAEIRAKYETPEQINDGRRTAPSKRILSVCSGYDKVIHGSLIAMDIGLDTIRAECPIFDSWIKSIEALHI